MTSRLYLRYRGHELPPLDQERATLGRGDFDISIDDPSVSRRGHAEVLFRGGRFWVRPLQAGREVRIDDGAPLQLEDEVVLPAQGALTLGTARIEYSTTGPHNAPAPQPQPLPPIAFRPSSIAVTPAAEVQVAPPSAAAPPPRSSADNPSGPACVAAALIARPPLTSELGGRKKSAGPRSALQAAACLGLLALACLLGLWLGVRFAS